MIEIENDEITVAEVQALVKKVEEFYAARGNPKFNMIWLADSIVKRLHNDLDYYVNIEGKKGFGKSNFILLLCILQCRYSGLWKNKKTGKIVKVLPRNTPLPPEWEHIKFGFQFRKNMSFFDNTEELKKKYYSLDRYHPFIIDEGSKNLHKYQWSSKLQFLLIQMSDTERYQNKSFYVCFPNFKELNSVFRNDRIEMRIFIYNKNVKQHYSSAIVSLKDVNRYVSDPWNTEENGKQFDYLLRKTPVSMRTPAHILYAESKMKGYAGTFDIPDLNTIAPSIWSTYMKYKISNAKKEGDSVEEVGELESARLKRAKNSIFNLVTVIRQKFPGMTYTKLGEIMGISPMTMSKLMNDDNFRRKEDEIKAKYGDIEFK